MVGGYVSWRASEKDFFRWKMVRIFFGFSKGETFFPFSLTCHMPWQAARRYLCCCCKSLEAGLVG